MYVGNLCLLKIFRIDLTGSQSSGVEPYKSIALQLVSLFKLFYIYYTLAFTSYNINLLSNELCRTKSDFAKQEGRKILSPKADASE